MSVGTTGLLIAAGIGAAGSIGGSLISANAAGSAADKETAQEDKALDFQEGVYNDTKANQQPFVSGGQYTLGQLIAGFQNGTFGPGSIPAFKAPTLADAQSTPGYQFTQQQGEQGIERGAAAAGGAITGGTLKSLAGFDTGLADSTYNDVFNRAMASYNSLLTGQNQSFNQLTSIAGLGENAAANVGNNGAQASNTIGNTLANIGNAQAAGTVGTANAVTSGINGAVNSATLPLYLQYLRPQVASQIPAGSTNPSTLTQYGAVPPVPAQTYDELTGGG
jgi:hypothetical protein